MVLNHPKIAIGTMTCLHCAAAFLLALLQIHATSHKLLWMAPAVEVPLRISANYRCFV
jgi:hypothetical protein